MKISLNSSPWSGVLVVITLHATCLVSGFNIIATPKLLAKPCYSSLRMEPGVCVSTWECIKADGKRLGICANGFLFGVCCGTKELDRSTTTSTTSTSTSTTTTTTTTTAAPSTVAIRSPPSTTVRPFTSSTIGSFVRFPPVKTQSHVTSCDSCVNGVSSSNSGSSSSSSSVTGLGATATPFTVTSSNMISFPGSGLKGSIKNGIPSITEITSSVTPASTKLSSSRPHSTSAGTEASVTTPVSTTSTSTINASTGTTGSTLSSAMTTVTTVKETASSVASVNEAAGAPSAGTQETSSAMAQSSTPSSSTTSSSTSSKEGEANVSIVKATTTATPLATSTVSLPSSTVSVNTSGSSSSSSGSSSSSASSAQLTNSEVCGRRFKEKVLRKTGRIVGGALSKFLEWPWMVSLRQWKKSSFQHKCGAALLNNYWAITAAHCVENVASTDLLLRLGEYDISNENEPYPYIERRVHVVAPHPQFDPRTFEYDLALLRLYEPVTYTHNIRPICVATGNDSYVGKSATVTGWGRLHEDGPLPDVLQHVDVPVITNKECESMYRRAGYIEEIPNIFICAGLSKGAKDSCEGDSGGPLVIENKGRWELIGVISWGIGCALPNQPGVYTRITEFSNWINQIIEFYR